MFKDYPCDGCGKPLTKNEGKSDDGYNKFCTECWEELEIQTEVINNEREGARDNG